jgi:hypothetical protein
MGDEKRLNDLQDEIKLLKGELKNSLASVRDYLLNMELPSSEFSTILAALSGENAAPQKMTVDSSVSNKEQPEEMPEPTFEEPPPEEEEELKEPEDLTTEEEELPEEETPEEETQEEELPEDELEETEDTEPEEIEEPAPEDELPMEEALPMELDQMNKDANQGVPKVNMLANLINWVSKAKQDIGYEQLPTFLEVYGITGHLSLELKEVILRLAEIAKEHPEELNDSELWSQSMLSLHGILTGGETPLHPVVPAWVDNADESDLPMDEEIIEIDKGKDKSPKLKLVFPNGDGENKEFCIDLTPDNNGNGNGNSSTHKK